MLDGSFYSMLLEINRLLVRFAQDQRSTRPPAWWESFRPLIEGFFHDEDWRLVLERWLQSQNLVAREEFEAVKAMAIAAEICVYTNGNLVVEGLESAR